jgi:2-methylcitrate dehydratase PrpD
MTNTAAADLAEALAEHAARTPFTAVSTAVRQQQADDLADGLAAVLGGFDAPGVATTRALVLETVRPGAAAIFGASERLPAAFAAQVNATAGHALDYDDVLDEGGGMHAGVPVHCATLAVADELGGVSGADYLAATAIGLDVAVRLALAPAEDYGWHRTSAFGIFGVTVAVGRLLGLDPETMRNALGIAYSQASGNRQCIADGALSKRLQSGFGARDGVQAVQLAQRGLTGARRIFEGVNGFFPLYQRGLYDRDSVLAGLGSDILSRRVALKPYPCGRNLHTAIDAALAVREQAGGRTIERVEVGVAAGPFASLTRAYPQDVVQAQFSVPFAVALALQTGALTIGAFARPEAAPSDVQALFARTTIVAWPEASGSATRVTAYFTDGSSASAEVAVASGHPTRPLSEAVLRAKFLDCAAAGGAPIAAERAGRVLELALGIDKLDDTRTLTAALRGGRDADGG